MDNMEQALQLIESAGLCDNLRMEIEAAPRDIIRALLVVSLYRAVDASALITEEQMLAGTLAEQIREADPPPESSLLTTAEVCIRLRWYPHEVKAAREQGRLIAQQVAGEYLFPTDQFDERCMRP